MANSEAFHQLHPLIQKYIWQEKWEDLREIQEMAIPVIKTASIDVIIAASTASGKTEAAYLPALSHLLDLEGCGLIVGIFPLKALINDQFGRLSRLCENLEIPVYPWHGDVAKSFKERFYKELKGVLLITPESLEALLCNRGASAKGFFEFATFFIVDELHYYIGSERGKQLQSLMHRIEISHGKNIPRIGLSATLGEIKLAAEFLRPNYASNVNILESKDYESAIKIQLKGFEIVEKKMDNQENASNARNVSESADNEELTSKIIAEHIFNNLRGSNNLIYPNSLSNVEKYADILRSICEHHGVSNEFWPHHGHLSKELREEAESALKCKDRPATAICTSTLELGIDIGSVKCVAQIGAPPSVASLRQRLGRSGRRKGESSILRAYSEELAIDDKSHISDRLRLETVKTCAMVTLLLEGWFEPPFIKGQHFSTLIQQILSSISQYGGIQPAIAYKLLCGFDSPFSSTSKEDFALILKQMGQKDLLFQDSSGLLLHGIVGEKCVQHYSFYAAFTSQEEYRIIAGNKPIGMIPISNMPIVGQNILLGGKGWLVQQIEEKEKTIYVVKANSGEPPKTSSSVGIHTVVAQRMRNILRGKIKLDFLDMTARRFIDEGIKQYANLNLDNEIRIGNSIMTWMGTNTNLALGWMFNYTGIRAFGSDCLLECGHISPEAMNSFILKMKDCSINAEELLKDTKLIAINKWDWALPKSLLIKSYASLNLNIEEAQQWIRDNHEKLRL